MMVDCMEMVDGWSCRERRAAMVGWTGCGGQRPRPGPVPGSVVDDLGSDAAIGEDLEEQALRQAAVDKMHALHAFLKRADGRGDLRPHAFVDDPPLLQVVDLADLQGGDQRLRVRR